MLDIFLDRLFGLLPWLIAVAVILNPLQPVALSPTGRPARLPRRPSRAGLGR